MKKIEWSATLICEIVFGMIGAIFTALGVVFGIYIDELAMSPGSRGNVYILPWVFCGIGIVFLIVFAILFCVGTRKQKTRRYLIENGKYINASVIAVNQDYSVRVNRSHPYYVICEGADPYTGEKLTFRSADTMENPSHLLGKYLRVFVDFSNPKEYYVELNRCYDER